MTCFTSDLYPPTPTFHDDDPWTRILVPALLGQESEAVEAMIELEAGEVDDLGTLLAVSARALVAMGRLEAAEDVCRRSLALGNQQAAALATFLFDDGLSWATARGAAGPAGERADAACDLALLLLRDDDFSGAREAIDQAQRVCPEHREAQRWRRFLDEAGSEALVLLEDPAIGAPTHSRPCERDAAELTPMYGTGLLSFERLIRRMDSGAWQIAAPSGTALHRLQQAGCNSRMVAMDSDYLCIASDHGLVPVELAVDQVSSLHAEGRPTARAATEAWRLAQAHDGIAADDVANFLVPHAIGDPACTQVGLQAAMHMCSEDPDTRLWPAYRARLLAQAGATDEAAALAREILTERGLQAMEAWQALDALRAAGRHDEAKKRARVLRKNPLLKKTVRVLVECWEAGEEHRPTSTGRIHPRFGRSMT